MKSVRLFNSIQATLVVACLAVIGCNSRSEVKAAKRSVTNQYHGVKVVDQYQWLENGAVPAVQQWTASQNRKAEAREWAERVLARKTTMPRYLQRRERPWFRKAKALLKKL